jgi:hypothetical protein
MAQISPRTASQRDRLRGDPTTRPSQTVIGVEQPEGHRNRRIVTPASVFVAWPAGAGCFKQKAWRSAAMAPRTRRHGRAVSAVAFAARARPSSSPRRGVGGVLLIGVGSGYWGWIRPWAPHGSRRGVLLMGARWGPVNDRETTGNSRVVQERRRAAQGANRAVAAGRKRRPTNLAKVGVAGSNPVVRSGIGRYQRGFKNLLLRGRLRRAVTPTRLTRSSESSGPHDRHLPGLIGQIRAWHRPSKKQDGRLRRPPGRSLDSSSLTTAERYSSSPTAADTRRSSTQTDSRPRRCPDATRSGRGGRSRRRHPSCRRSR